jgi:acyl-CoA thioesterase FadM
VKASCEYKSPLRFNDVIEVRLVIKEVRSKAVVYVFQFRRTDAGRVLPEVLAQGEIAAVCVTSDAAGKMVAQPIPAEVRAKLEPAAPGVYTP